MKKLKTQDNTWEVNLKNCPRNYRKKKRRERKGKKEKK